MVGKARELNARNADVVLLDFLQVNSVARLLTNVKVQQLKLNKVLAQNVILIFNSVAWRDHDKVLLNHCLLPFQTCSPLRFRPHHNMRLMDAEFSTDGVEDHVSSVLTDVHLRKLVRHLGQNLLVLRNFHLLFPSVNVADCSPFDLL